MDSDSSSSSSQGTIVRQRSSEAPVPAPRQLRRNYTSNDKSLTEEDIVDKILLQNRNDRMYELRRIQHGEKPVTGTDTIEKLEKLLAEDAEVPEERRPQAVLVEVHDLSQTRPVHALLQSTAFRHRLEGIVRGSISAAQRSASNLQLPQLVHERVEAQSVVSSSSSSSLSALGAAAPRIRPRRRPFNSQFAEELSSRLLAGRRPNLTPQTIAPHTSLPPSTSLSAPADADAQGHVSGWLESTSREPTNSDAHVWGTLEEAQREQMVFEISELVHRQLVTTTLESEFRGRLEASMMDRQQRSGADGRRVANFINELPRGQVLRNDFSHLGLEQRVPQAVDDADSLSFVSAAAVPISHTNAVMSREISCLKSQLKEMKQMMKLTFDLQLDLQRSIRQEVAAALVSATPTVAASTPVRTKPVDDSKCLICVESAADSVLYQCGHLCLCYACGMRLQQRGDHCPICRAPIKDIIRAYKTSVE